MSKNRGEKLRKVERGGEVAPRGAAVWLSVNVFVFHHLLQCYKKWLNESRAGFILHWRLAHPRSQLNKRQQPAEKDPKLNCYESQGFWNENIFPGCNLTLFKAEFWTRNEPLVKFLNLVTEQNQKDLTWTLPTLLPTWGHTTDDTSHYWI